MSILAKWPRTLVMKTPEQVGHKLMLALGYNEYGKISMLDLLQLLITMK